MRFLTSFLLPLLTLAAVGFIFYDPALKHKVQGSFQTALVESPAISSLVGSLTKFGVLNATFLAPLLAYVEPVLDRIDPSSSRSQLLPDSLCVLHNEDPSSCGLSSVEDLNRLHVHPLISQIVRMPFFQFFKVDLHCDCPFWPEDGMCSLRDCSVCECPEDEVPAPWREKDRDAPPESPSLATESCGSTEGQGTRDASVDRSIDALGQQVVLGAVSDTASGPATGDGREVARKKGGWNGTDNPWTTEPGGAESEYTYVNLLKNPERYTGYKGLHARRIWSAIYGHSCFKEADACPANKLFYRLISGMHTSITAHICAEFLLNEHRQEWGPNYALYLERLGTPEAKPYLENLYFAYLFVMRAAVKAAPILTKYEYNTGLKESDVRTALLVKELLFHRSVLEACPVPFDEARLWKGEDGQRKRLEMEAMFRNLTQIMNCVGCEKCKLWGKLQILGMGTALKILFSEDDCLGGGGGAAPLALSRNEVIALLNFLGRLSSSVESIRAMNQALAEDDSLARRAVGGAMTSAATSGEDMGWGGGLARPEENLGSVFGL